MNLRKTTSKWIVITVILFFSGIGVFLMSVFFGERARDPDTVEFLGWFAMLGLLGLTSLSASHTLRASVAERNRPVKFFEDSQA